MEAEGDSEDVELISKGGHAQIEGDVSVRRNPSVRFTTKCLRFCLTPSDMLELWRYRQDNLLLHVSRMSLRDLCGENRFSI